MEKIKELKKALDFMKVTSDITSIACKNIKNALDEIEIEFNDQKQ